MSEIVLGGCTPTPLASYLKALGVLRLLSVSQPETKAAWRDEKLRLQTPLSREEIEGFFLDAYIPTPIMAPWNGGSGFYEKDNKDALEAIVQCKDTRLSAYQRCFVVVEDALDGMDRQASPKGDQKASLLLRLRGLLPDDALAWLDAAVLLSGDMPQYPPLLGTGGNDGRLDFTNNFMQRLLEALCLDRKITTAESRDWLRLALFGDSAPGLIKKAIGQFSPGQAGGPNASNGFDADAAINPWDFVLMIEGSLPFAAAVVRRSADDPYGVLSYPFTVKAVSAGSGSLGEGDTTNARGELWMPLWGQPASYGEVRSLLSEGRVAVGRKPARDAVDFVRAVHHLGAYRGIRSFQRYGLLMRSGKAYLATPLGRVETSDRPSTNLLDELDQQNWLGMFRKFAQGDAPERFVTMRRRLENVFFRFSEKIPPPNEIQASLTLVGEIQAAIAGSSKAADVVGPVPRLSERWVDAADDGSCAFRIARALAGLRGEAALPLPIRAQLFPVHPLYSMWKDQTDKDQHNASDQYRGVRLYTGMAGTLCHALFQLLNRRLWLAERLEMQDRPLQSTSGATLQDVNSFLESDRMDQRIASLVPGLSLCEVPFDTEQADGEGSVPAAFALLKLSLTSNSILHKLDVLTKDKNLSNPRGMLQQLASAHAVDRAVLAAWRQLRISSVNPVFDRNALPSLAGISPRRVAAALLIPLRLGAYRRVANGVLKTDDSAGESAA